jgi:hypothetical protein
VTHYLIATLTVLLGCAYPALVIAGKVPPANRLSASEIAFMVLAIATGVALASPRFLRALRKLKISGFELELDRVREQQRRQRVRIAEIDMLLPLLMPDEQFRHLENLLNHNTGAYRGGDKVRQELRQLASSGLIRRRLDRQIASLKNDGRFDLADYVELTPLGTYWGERYIGRKRHADAEGETKETSESPAGGAL